MPRCALDIFLVAIINKIDRCLQRSGYKSSWKCYPHLTPQSGIRTYRPSDIKVAVCGYSSMRASADGGIAVYPKATAFCNVMGYQVQERLSSG